MLPNILITAGAKLANSMWRWRLSFWIFLEKSPRLLEKLGPSRLFNLMKAPWQFMVLLRVVENPAGVVMFMTFWAILAFWVSRRGPRCFWVSIALQLLYIGIPEFLLVFGSVSTSESTSMAMALQFNETWPLWVFVAGLLLEIIERFGFEEKLH